MKKQDKKTLEKTEIICDKCGYEWTTLSSMIMVTCPSCLSKVRRCGKVVEMKVSGGDEE